MDRQFKETMKALESVKNFSLKYTHSVRCYSTNSYICLDPYNHSSYSSYLKIYLYKTPKIANIYCYRIKDWKSVVKRKYLWANFEETFYLKIINSFSKNKHIPIIFDVIKREIKLL